MKIESDDCLEALVHVVLFELPRASDTMLDDSWCFPKETDLEEVVAASKVIRAYELYRTELEQMEEKLTLLTELYKEDPKDFEMKEDLDDLLYSVTLRHPRGIRRVREAARELLEPMTVLDNPHTRAVEMISCLWWHIRNGVEPDLKEEVLYTLKLHRGMPESLLL